MTNLPQKILLVDKRRPLCDAWSQAFQKFPNVEVVEGDFFSWDADAMVSPANSFGIMDGGLDLAIRNALDSPERCSTSHPGAPSRRDSRRRRGDCFHSPFADGVRASARFHALLVFPRLLVTMG